MEPDNITSPLVQMFMGARGAEYPTSANRERTFLGIVMKWGKAWGFVKIEDPTAVVKTIKVKPGGRYVEDWEYQAFWQWLGDRGHVMHQCAMEISYLCAARQQDVLALTRADIQEDGLLIVQAKTGKAQLKLWSTALKEAVDLAVVTNTEAQIQPPPYHSQPRWPRLHPHRVQCYLAKGTTSSASCWGNQTALSLSRFEDQSG
ncbi:hypothetical protein [Microbulbifer sp. ANSA005]|uniref:hypothetical protein n=1 Tax=Microbulbifer sp. ANSA005 TaxID=3243362 RepID=UPI004042ADAF